MHQFCSLFVLDLLQGSNGRPRLRERVSFPRSRQVASSAGGDHCGGALGLS
jgi:hypothetical protein